MADSIKDGTGSGYTVKVDKNNRAFALSKSEGFGESLAKEGHSYNFNSSTLSLSGDNTTSQLWYFKNNGDNDIIITNLVYLLGSSSGGTGNIIVSVHKNPFGGTLISSGVSKAPENINFGSSHVLDVISLVGGEGFTITGSGGKAYESLLANDGVAYNISTNVIVIPKGSSLSVEIVTQVGNINMDLQVAANIYENA